MGAVGPLAENYLEASFVRIWWKRAFWLACLFIAELFTFTALTFFESAIAEIVVLSLFVPLCISTGGNSGSQAATLITRAIALGQVELRSMDLLAAIKAVFRGQFAAVWGQLTSIAGNVWALLRVVRHELLLGIALGLTLGVDRLRPRLADAGGRAQEPRHSAGIVRHQRADGPRVGNRQSGERTALIEPPVLQTITEQHKAQVTWPDDEDLVIDRTSQPGRILYYFPKKCTIRHEAVDRWRLALVISQAVAAICLWGTLIGAILPIVFKSLGFDPGIASSPFVATFVDVTGIVIYFTIATIWLL